MLLILTDIVIENQKEKFINQYHTNFNNMLKPSKYLDKLKNAFTMLLTLYEILNNTKLYPNGN